MGGAGTCMIYSIYQTRGLPYFCNGPLLDMDSVQKDALETLPLASAC
jgi:hypothetical protein